MTDGSLVLIDDMLGKVSGLLGSIKEYCDWNGTDDYTHDAVCMLDCAKHQLEQEKRRLKNVPRL